MVIISMFTWHARLKIEILLDGESSELDPPIDGENEHGDSSYIHTWIGGGQVIYEMAIYTS